MASDPLASAIDEICELAHKVMTERDRLRAFADAVMEHWQRGGDCDGFELQELGLQYGLLEGQEMEAPCGDDDTCGCLEFHDPADGPWTCYRKTKLLTGDDDGER